MVPDLVIGKKRGQIQTKQELLGQFSSTVEQDCTTKKDDFRVLGGWGGWGWG